MNGTPQRVLIVGASRGIGLEFVRQYAEQGAAVTATARSDDGLARITALGARALRLDVATAAGAAALAWPIDGEAFEVLVLVAGVYGPRSAGLQPPTQDEFDTVMHTNVLGAMRVLPQLAEVLAPGARLAVISSRMGSIGLRASASGWLYRASKAALNSLLKDASIELAGRAICVSFHPGWVRTDMGGSSADIDVATSVSDMRRTLAALTPADNGGFFNHDGQPLAW
jgi:NAD(P)-dependent dehydrogenase (short-subunit alcohol dehydrogenase family)